MPNPNLINPDLNLIIFNPQHPNLNIRYNPTLCTTDPNLRYLNPQHPNPNL
ncbi:Berberine bridge enzyme-like 15, partial [Clarias magur]